MVLVPVTLAPKAAVQIDLDPTNPYSNELEKACTALAVERDAESMVFVVQSTREYLSEDQWNSTLVLAGKGLELVVRPEIAAGESIYQMNSPDPRDKKNAIFKLKSLLVDVPFATTFVERGGVDVLTKIVLSGKGNLLSYALAAFPLAVADWSAVPPELMEKVVASLSDSNQNVVKNSLSLLNGLFSGVDPSTGNVGEMIHAHFRASGAAGGASAYDCLLTQLSSTDLDVQVLALSAVNGIIAHSRAAERDAFLVALDAFGFNGALKAQLNAIDVPAFREAAFVYQQARLVDECNLLLTNFDPDDASHDHMLLRYFTAVFPTDILRELSDFRRLGFQTTDPASELRTTGMLGITACIELFDKAPQIGRAIVDAQARRPERDYPFTAAWNSVISLLVDLLAMRRERVVGEPGTVFLSLLDDVAAPAGPSSGGGSSDDSPIGLFGGSPFLEVFAICIQGFDKAWNDLNATYEDFPKAVAILKAKLGEVIMSNPDSLSALKRATFSMATGLKKRIGCVDDAFTALGLRVVEAPVVEDLRKSLSGDMMSLVAAQRLATMRAGAVFAAYKQDGKTVKKFVVSLRLGDSGQDLRVGIVPDSGGSLADGAARITSEAPVFVADIHAVAVGASSPMVMALKKPDPRMTELAFSIVLKQPMASSGEMTVDAVARDRREYVAWTDGLRVLNGQPLLSPESAADAEKLAEMELRVRMAEIDGVEVPSGVPDTPPPPPSTFVLTPDQIRSVAGLLA